MLAIRLLAMEEKLSLDVTHKMSNRIRNPDGDVVGEGTAELNVEGSSARPEWLAAMTLAMGVRFEAAVEGTYTLEFQVDDAVDQLPIHVVHGQPGD